MMLVFEVFCMSILFYLLLLCFYFRFSCLLFFVLFILPNLVNKRLIKCSRKVENKQSRRLSGSAGEYTGTYFFKKKALHKVEGSVSCGRMWAEGGIKNLISCGRHK